MVAELRDLESLTLAVREPMTRVYFQDAVRCHNAGAFRPAISAVCTAVVFDLIMKYRELSLHGDKAAESFLEKWDSARENHAIDKQLQLERTILEDARDRTMVIQEYEAQKLERLRSDRNLCSHPAFVTDGELVHPSAELSRLHLVEAAETLLIQAPIQGKAIIEQFSNDVQSTAFPSSYPRIVEYVSTKYLARTRKAAILNLGVCWQNHSSNKRRKSGIRTGPRSCPPFTP